MRLLDHSYDAPEENLALDEVLLDEAEAGRIDETLRLWMSPRHFVVLGLSQAFGEHVIQEACERECVPILRRCSAGGCVLQGPGCLNFSLVLRTDRPGCETIHASYRTILGTVAEALAQLGQPAALEGISDLSIAGQKLSGNAQRRRKNFFLHHGTLLFNFDIPLCARYLKEPHEQPEYRNKRGHTSFIANISVDQNALVRTVSSVFHAKEIARIDPRTEQAVRELVRDKYSQQSWTFRK